MSERRGRRGGADRPAGLWLAAVPAATLSLACAQPILEPTLIPIAPADARPAAAADRLDDYPAALQAIVDVFETELDLPRPDVTLVLFANHRSFEAGLLSIGYPPELARDASSFGAIGGARAVLANGGILDAMSRRERVRLLAHELTHSVQYVFAGGHRGASDQWLREGVADWVAFRTLEALGYSSYENARRRLLERLADVPSGTAPAPLDALATFPQWVAAQSLYRDLPLYAQAFLAAELLIEEHGFETVRAYFERFAASDDRTGIFRETFGLDLTEFARGVDRRWRQELLSHQLLR